MLKVRCEITFSKLEKLETRTLDVVGETLDDVSRQLHQYADMMEDEGWLLKESKTLSISRFDPRKNGG